MCLGFSKHRTLGKQIQQILTLSPHCTWWGEYPAHAVFQSSFTPSNPRVRLCFHLFHTTAAFLPHLFLAPSFILCFLLSVSHSFIFSPSLPWKNHSEHNRHKTWIQSRAAPPPHTHTHRHAQTQWMAELDDENTECRELCTRLCKLDLNCYFTFPLRTVHAVAHEVLLLTLKIFNSQNPSVCLDFW